MTHLLALKDHLCQFGTINNPDQFLTDYPSGGLHTIIDNHLEIYFFLLGDIGGSKICYSQALLPHFLSFFNFSVDDFEFIFNLYVQNSLKYGLMDSLVTLKNDSIKVQNDTEVIEGIYNIPLSKFNTSDSRVDVFSKCFVNIVLQHIGVDEPILNIHFKFPYSSTHAFNVKIQKTVSQDARYFFSSIRMKDKTNEPKYEEVGSDLVHNYFIDKYIKKRVCDLVQQVLGYKKRDVLFDIESIQQYKDLIGMINCG